MVSGHRAGAAQAGEFGKVGGDLGAGGGEEVALGETEVGAGEQRVEPAAHRGGIGAAHGEADLLILRAEPGGIGGRDPAGVGGEGGSGGVAGVGEAERGEQPGIVVARRPAFAGVGAGSGALFLRCAQRQDPVGGVGLVLGAAGEVEIVGEAEGDGVGERASRQLAVELGQSAAGWSR